ncbi:CDK5 regulatory subunit-associated protein 2 isoform X2 [Thalassophryne amazonica]|uniref:CDK5 regulatory subunit-associated protein 2 isoform X2 n=1 Tax=Thalassophryne amazonica TaxID=390379 RepID=UPI001470E5F7|nr:CDK5 regulatory subunit-associated protein 2 isoform X2 [Thalassophryne amazonica]
MKDPCRICGVRLVGSQCRWIFSSSAKRKLQVILSHVLGCEVTRDGHGEFLCGKCVFQLEKVVQCDVCISRLQNEYSAQIQKLQVEKEHLIQCIVCTYNKNNPVQQQSDGKGTGFKIKPWTSGIGSPDNEATSHLESEEKLRDSSNHPGDNCIRRCVSLDRIGSKGTLIWRSGLRTTRLGSGAGFESCLKSFGLRDTRHSTQSIYLNLVQSRGTLPRPGFKGRSTSLQSLSQDFAPETPADAHPKLKCKESKVLIAKRGATNEQRKLVQGRALSVKSSRQVSVISDLIQLLHCISKQQVPAHAGSRIPVPKRLTPHSSNSKINHRHADAEWKSLHDLTEEFEDEYIPVRLESEVTRLEFSNRQLSEELILIKTSNDNLAKTLEEAQNQNKALCGKLEEKENELSTEKKNILKRDKTIQGLAQVVKEKEKENEKLCQEIEDRDAALAKARDSAHKAQLQKYQGAEEHQNLLMAKETELVQLQGEHHAKVLEAQKLQHGLDRKEQDLAELQQVKEQLELELEDLQQQKKRGDKALNDLNNQLKKLTSELGDRESALEQQYHELLEQTKRKLQFHEVTNQRLASILADKEQQLQEYMNMVRDLEQNKSPGGSDGMLHKLWERLKEKEKALEQALDEKFTAIDEKCNEIHQLQLSLREKERDLDRLNNVLSHNEETINSFDHLIKEKDVELQHLANTLKNLQRSKQEVEDNLNRSLREKDSIITQLKLSLEGKTKDMEEMTETLLSQSQTHARDLTVQMGQRLKVTEVMLAEAVKAKEKLVADNGSAVEAMLATISSKDQLIKESADHHNRMLSECNREVQDLKKQLSDAQQHLTTAEKQNSTAIQEMHVETAALRALLDEKDSIINKLLQRGQERDQFLAEMRQKESDYTLELKQTIQIMQDKLAEKEVDLSRRNSEDNGENLPHSKKTFVVLKKELAQKTEALNEALKRENELKIALAELQSLFNEVESCNEGQAANIESLTATLKTKDEMISVLHQRLVERGDSQTDHSSDQGFGSGMERSLPSLPQRETTMIGGDSQQEGLPSILNLQQEHVSLNKALRAEQQLYSSLVRTVKEQDSAQRLHALQLELTAVQLLRQQLEQSIKTNEELREDLERELHRAKQRADTDTVDPKELESMRHQLEDAQRWNASLQARLGAIQNRGRGVGGANDSCDTLNFTADQTSYMSIFVGEGQDDSLSLLSVQELRQKVLELQECVSRLQSLNNELQNKLEHLSYDASCKEDQNLINTSPGKQQLEKEWTQNNVTQQPCLDKESQTDFRLGQMVTGMPSHDQSVDRGHGLTREHAHPGTDTLDNVERDTVEPKGDVVAIDVLLKDCGATSVSHLIEEVLRLRSENVELRGFLKEHRSTEPKEKESADTSGDSSDGQTARCAEAKGYSEVIMLLKEKREKNSHDVFGESKPVIMEMEKRQTTGQLHSTSAKWDVGKHRPGVRSRLPIPVRVRTEVVGNKQFDNVQRRHLDDDCGSDQHSPTDSDAPLTHQHASSTFSPEGLNKRPETRQTLDHNRPDSALVNQLELLDQECREKEALINELTKQLADLEELHVDCQKKDGLNRQYEEALQAAESTIAYLTACNLDNQRGFGSSSTSCTGSGSVCSDAALHSRCMELQKTLQEKEELNKQLIELLNMAEKAMSSVSAPFTPSDHSEKMSEINDLCLRIENALQLAAITPIRQSPRENFEGSDGSVCELQRHVDSLQEALREQNNINAELQEKLMAAEAAAQHGYSSTTAGLDDNYPTQMAAEEFLKKEESNEDCGTMGMSEHTRLNQEMNRLLMNCLIAADAAIASLTAHCTSTSSTEVSPDLKKYLDRLERALQEKTKLTGMVEPTQPVSESISNESTAVSGTGHQDLHHNLRLLCKVFSDCSLRISELQALLQDERSRKEERNTHRTLQESKGLSPNVQAQLETLHKTLREKKKAYKSLEEKLANTQSIIASSKETAQKMPPLELDDKGVQVDFQDLGYETNGKSENDREECSSTDIEVGVNPSCSASSLSAFLKHEQATFSSIENLDSTSSTPYLSSPALSSAKASLKSLQVYEDYGASGDPLLLQAQVRELKVQLESQTKVILQMQNFLHQNSLSGDLVASTPDPSAVKDQEETQEDHTQDKGSRTGQLKVSGEGENQLMKDKTVRLSLDLEREKTLNRSINEKLQQTQQRSRSTSPARLDSLVQSQARELSQLRQQIKESHTLGTLQRQQLDKLNNTFKELLQATKVDGYKAEVVQEQLEKCLSILGQLKCHLDKGHTHLDNEDVEGLELLHSLSKELQEKNHLIQSLQNQYRSKSPSSHHSSHSDLSHSDEATSSCRSSSDTLSGQQCPTDWTGVAVSSVRGAEGSNVSGHREAARRLQGLLRENGRLQEQLRSSEDLNATLRSELDLHRSIMAQTGSQHHDQKHTLGQDGTESQKDINKGVGDSPTNTSGSCHTMTPDLLAEHLQEIRALRQRLEESIRTNDSLREQLERRLAEVDKDPAATNIFIHGNEDQGHLAKEVKFLRKQNQSLKEQLSVSSRDKQKENERLRETLARRTAKLEQSRMECEALRQEKHLLQERLEHSGHENAQLQNSLRYSRDELQRLQSEVTRQRQDLSDSQHLLQSLRVELQVYEKIKTEVHKHNESSKATQEPVPVPPSGSVDLSELLSEIRHLRLQMERSIQTNTALRQRLEEQLLTGHNRPETININYMLSSPDEGGRSPRHEGYDALHHSFIDDDKHRAASEVGGQSISSSSPDSVPGVLSRLVPGHRLWASRSGRHILGLIEDYEALHKQISEGRKLSRTMDTQLQECLRAITQQCGDNKVIEQQHWKSLSSNINTMQQVLEEAGRLLKLVWRVSVPAGIPAGESGDNQQYELLKNEITRLKSRLWQQERMLSGAVKRLRTTNQVKAGMERVIIDQLSLTHGVLKRARGNLEANYCTLIGLKDSSGGPDEGGPSEWPVGGGEDQADSPVCRHTDASDENSDVAFP